MAKVKWLLYIFVQPGCPHCEALLSDNLFRRFLRAYQNHVVVVNVSDDWGLNLASQFIYIDAADRLDQGPRVVKTPMMVLVYGSSVYTLRPRGTGLELWEALSGLLARISENPVPLPYPGERRRRGEE